MSPASLVIFHGVVRVVRGAFVRAPHLSPACSPRTVPSAATLKSSASPLNSPRVLALPSGVLSVSLPSAAFPAATSFFPSCPSANRFTTPSTKSPANKLFSSTCPAQQTRHPHDSCLSLTALRVDAVTPQQQQSLATSSKGWDMALSRRFRPFQIHDVR